MKEETRSKWPTQIFGSIVIQLVTAAIIGTVIMYGTTERLTERMDRFEGQMDQVMQTLVNVQIELAERKE